LALPASLPTAAADLIALLLVPKPQSRLGYAQLDDVKGHAFFRGVDWSHLREALPPTLRSSMR